MGLHAGWGVGSRGKEDGHSETESESLCFAQWEGVTRGASDPAGQLQRPCMLKKPGGKFICLSSLLRFKPHLKIKPVFQLKPQHSHQATASLGTKQKNVG